MRRLSLGLACLALASCGPGATGAARSTGEVGRACLASDRSGAGPGLCACIDRAAAQTLTTAEQGAAAGYFADPEALQAMKLDDRPAAERMWARYENFTQTARALCS